MKTEISKVFRLQIYLGNIAIKMKTVIILSIFFMTMVSATCNTKFDCANQVYSFTIGLNSNLNLLAQYQPYWQ